MAEFSLLSRAASMLRV